MRKKEEKQMLQTIKTHKTDIHPLLQKGPVWLHKQCGEYTLLLMLEWKGLT